MLAQLRRTLEQVEHADGAGGNHRRDAVREQIRTGSLAQPGDDFLARRDEAAAGASQRLAERTGQDVDAAHDPAQFMRAAPAGADEAAGMGIIDHHQGI